MSETHYEKDGLENIILSSFMEGNKVKVKKQANYLMIFCEWMTEQRQGAWVKQNQRVFFFQSQGTRSCGEPSSSTF